MKPVLATLDRDAFSAFMSMVPARHRYLDPEYAKEGYEHLVVAQGVILCGEPQKDATIRVLAGFGQASGTPKYPKIAIQVRGVKDEKDEVASVTLCYSELEFKQNDADSFGQLLAARLSNALRTLQSEVQFTAKKRKKKFEGAEFVRKRPDGYYYPYSEEKCPNHVASPEDRKVCALCGTHVNELRPPEGESE